MRRLCGMRTSLALLLILAALLAAVRGMMNLGQGSAGDGGTQALDLYCAAGMRRPVEELCSAYERETGVPVRIQYAGSGTLLSSLQASRSGDLYVAGDVSFVDRAVELIETHHATTCVSATPFLRELVDAARHQGKDLPSFRLFACGGAAVPSALIYDASEVLANCRAVRVYGSTEVPLVTVGFVGEGETQLAAETDGRVSNYEVRICDDDGQDVGLNVDGEIWVRGPAMMQGYRDADQNAAAFSEDGFFKTGDIGQLLESQAIVITDRKKDIIIRGGENLSAREIEEVVMLHPAVAEAAAVSAPHTRLGEGVAVFVTLYDSEAPALEDLTALCAEQRLAKQKWPQWLGVVKEMPKTPSGKIQKAVLRQQLQADGVELS